MVNENILSIQGLSKSYGSIKAVDSLDLEVKKGQVFWFVRPKWKWENNYIKCFTWAYKAAAW